MPREIGKTQKLLKQIEEQIKRGGIAYSFSKEQLTKYTENIINDVLQKFEKLATEYPNLNNIALLDFVKDLKRKYNIEKGE